MAGGWVAKTRAPLGTIWWVWLSSAGAAAGWGIAWKYPGGWEAGNGGAGTGGGTPAISGGGPLGKGIDMSQTKWFQDQLGKSRVVGLEPLSQMFVHVYASPSPSLSLSHFLIKTEPQLKINC